MKTKYTLELVNKDRIEYCRENPGALTKRQKAQAKLNPLTHGALPEMILTGRASRAAARIDAEPYLKTHLAIITPES
jgi:hypothetical protein